MTVPVGALVIGSTNAAIGLPAAMAVLRGGGSAMDAVVAGIRPVEANPDDHSVGYSGLPNLLGDVELDASVMDGRGLRSGAVGALRGYQDAIVLARAVMDELPHAFIAGDGARRLAAELGLSPRDLRTPEASAIWQRRIEGIDPSDDDLARARRLVSRVSRDPELPELPEPPHGTVNVIARDADGTIASGVSTSGWAWKYPGRLGDSPVVGAGNYADDRYGAAACTGRGEMALRCATAHSVVMFLRFGMDVDAALRTAVGDLNALDDPYASEVNIVAMDASGRHAAASTVPHKTYVWMDESTDAPVEASRHHVSAESQS